MKSNQILHAYNCISIPRSKKGIKFESIYIQSVPRIRLGNYPPIINICRHRDISIKEATTQCADIKALQKIQQGFMRVMNVSSWDEAKEMYPQHTTPEKLEPFKHLNFSGHQLPQQFLQFCQHIRATESTETSTEDFDKVFVIKNGTTAILWKTDITNVTVDLFEETFNRAGVDKCLGFSLALFDYSSNEMSIDQVRVYTYVRCSLFL